MSQHADTKNRKYAWLDNEPTAFDIFLLNNMAAVDYWNLPAILTCSPHRVTKIKNNPAILNMETEAPILAAKMGIDLADLQAEVKRITLNK
ncbi:MAG: hypothetical protein EBX41_10435 [Chitinophagia bacterium]|nr:hypothetical protein [Chitinophagia bacterium]